MQRPPPPDDSLEFIANPGPTATRMRALDWTTSPLGPPQHWPAPLRALVSAMVDSRYPMFIAWGPQLGFLYNDGYAPILGGKHPQAVGRPFREIWSEIWHDIEPLIERSLAGEATWSDDLQLFMRRNGFDEEVYFTFSYSPVRDQHNRIQGMMCACSETTHRVFAERRIATLQALGQVAMRARTVEEAQRLCLAAIEADREDVPFALLYTLRGDTATLAGAVHMVAGGAESAVFGRDGRALWPFDAGSVRQVDGAALDAAFGAARPRSRWNDPVEQALVITVPDRNVPGDGLGLVLGVSPRRALDDGYRELFGVFADGIAAALATVAAYQAERRRSFLLALSEALRPAEGVTAVAAIATARLGGELGVFGAGLAEARGDDIQIRHQWRRRQSTAMRCAPPRLLADFGDPAELRQRACVAVADTRGDPRWAAWTAAGIRSLLAVAHVDDGAVAGVLWVCHDRPHDWTWEEVAFVRESMRRIWIERTRTEAVQAARESEARFRIMADSSPLLIWVLDADLRLLFVNRAYREFFGATPDQLARDGWLPLLHPDDAAEAVRGMRAGIDSRQPFSVRTRARRVDGAWRWLQLYATPRFSADGEFLGAVGSSPDITEIVEASNALRLADRRKDEFLATLAHELRNPLAALSAAAQVLESAAGAAALRQARQVVTRQVAQMARLLDDLLDVSRITLGKLELRRERVLLGEVVDAAVETARPGIDARGHRLQIEHDDRAAALDGDPVRLAQIFSNLLVNAAKYTDPGGRITLRTARDNGHWRVEVSDTGIGIPAAALDRVFTLFAQIDPALERSQGGLGIGLALTKGLLDLHGGTIAVRSEVGRGSTFSVRLPVETAPAARSEPVPPLRPAARRLRIVVADDNQDALDSLAILLEMRGHDVRRARNGAEAVALAAQHRPELVILDIGMPVMNGYEACHEMRQADWAGSAQFVALTGWGQRDDRERALAAGFHHHLTKPVDLELLHRLCASGAVGATDTADAEA